MMRREDTALLVISGVVCGFVRLAQDSTLIKACRTRLPQAFHPTRRIRSKNDGSARMASKSGSELSSIKSGLPSL